jgi:methyl-accepting chemotaxis protein
MRTSLRAKLLLSFIFLGLFPLLIMGQIGYHLARRSLRADAGTALVSMATQTGDKLDRNLYERYGDVQVFARSAQAQAMDREALTPWMNTLTATYAPNYTLMLVADAQGKVIATNTVGLDGKPTRAPELIGTSVSGSRWFQSAMSGTLKEDQSYVEDLHEDPLLLRLGQSGPAAMTMGFTTAIRDPKGKLIGVWTNRFNWQVALDLVDASVKQLRALGMTGARLHILDPSGMILLSENAPDILQRRINETPIFQQARAASAPAFAEFAALDPQEPGQQDFLAHARAPGFASYPGMGWLVLASQPVEHALHAATVLRRATLWIVVGAAVLIVLIALLIASSIGGAARRMAATAELIAETDLGGLIRAMNGLAQGDLRQEVRLSATPLAVTSRDEMGDLAHAFNQAITRLGEAGAALTTLIAYQEQMAGAARSIAGGDLQVQVTPKSQADVLGHAFMSMTAYLREMASAASRIAVGDVRVEVRPRSEADQLGRSFRQMIGYLNRIAESAGRIAHNDLTHEIRPLSPEDALGTAFAQMTTRLRQVVGSLTQNAQSLNSASAQLAKVGQNTAQGIGQIESGIGTVAQGATAQTEAVGRTRQHVSEMANTIVLLAQGAQQQASAVEHAVALTGSIGHAIEQVAESASVTMQEAKQARQAVLRGTETMRASADGMARLKASVIRSAEKVHEMNTRSVEIGQMVETIQNIASQTALLAVNASIEATRAGDQGAGFAVVASNVRTLATKASDSARQITELVDTIKVTIGEAVGAMTEGVREVEATVERAGQAQQALAGILEATDQSATQATRIAQSVQAVRTSSTDLLNAMNAVNRVVQSNAASAEELSNAAAELKEDVERIAGVSEQNTRTANHVNQATQHVSAQARDVTVQVTNLTELAVSLRRVVQQFQI